MSLRSAAALIKVTHSFPLASEFHAYFASYFWLWLWLLWLIPGLCSGPAHELSIAPHCSTCPLMGKTCAKSGRILLFHDMFSIFSSMRKNRDCLWRTSGDGWRQFQSLHLGFKTVSPGPSTYEETRLRQTQLTALAFCPGKADSQYWQFPFQIKTAWRHTELPCVGNLKDFLCLPVEWHLD